MVLCGAPGFACRAFWILTIGLKRQLGWQRSGKWRLEGNVKRKLQMRLTGMWGLPKATHHTRKSDPNAKRLYKQRQMWLREGHRDVPSVQLLCKCALGLHFKYRNLQRKSEWRDASGHVSFARFSFAFFFFLCLIFFGINFWENYILGLLWLSYKYILT